jgi:hypothetical protein
LPVAEEVKEEVNNQLRGKEKKEKKQIFKQSVLNRV